MHKISELCQETREEVWSSGAVGHPSLDVRNEKEGHFGIARRGSNWERKKVNSVLTILIPVGSGVEGIRRSESLGGGG